MLFHFSNFFPLAGVPTPAAFAACRFGWLGVPVFFVLSGFVLAYTAPTAAGPRAAGRFLVRRLVRLAPPYWATVLLMAAAVAAGHAVGMMTSTPTPPAGQVAAHLLYAQRLFGYDHLQDLFWTLCVEVQFYLLFALGLAAGNGRPVRVVAYLGFLASVGVRLAGLDSTDWFFGHWHTFAAGLAACQKLPLARFVVGYLLPLAVVAGWRASPVEAVAGVTALSLVVAGRRDALGRWLAARPLLWLGRRSYSLYLLHAFVGETLFHATKRWAGPDELRLTAVFALAVVASVLSAAVWYAVIELPAVGWSRRLRRGPT